MEEKDCRHCVLVLINIFMKIRTASSPLQGSEIWISPEGRVFYDYAFPPHETAEDYFAKGWIRVQSNSNGCLDVHHKYATRYAYARAMALLRQHDAELQKTLETDFQK
jgi:hypothetical protein